MTDLSIIRKFVSNKSDGLWAAAGSDNRKESALEVAAKFEAGRTSGTPRVEPRASRGSGNNDGRQNSAGGGKHLASKIHSEGKGSSEGSPKGRGSSAAGSVRGTATPSPVKRGCSSTKKELKVKPSGMATSPRCSTSVKRLSPASSVKYWPSPRSTRASVLRESRAAALRQGTSGTPEKGRADARSHEGSSSKPKSAVLATGARKSPRQPLIGGKGAGRKSPGVVHGGGLGVRGKVTKSACGRLEGSRGTLGGPASVDAAFLSLPVGDVEQMTSGPMDGQVIKEEELDHSSVAEQQSIQLVAEGQHFGRNSDRRRLLPEAGGRFGALSLNVGGGSPPITKEATRSAPAAFARPASPLPMEQDGVGGATLIRHAADVDSSRGSAIATAALHGPQSPLGSVSLREEYPAERRSSSLLMGNPLASGTSSPLFPLPMTWGALGQKPGQGLDDAIPKSLVAVSSQSMFPVSPTIQRRPSVPSSGAYKHVLSSTVMGLPPAMEMQAPLDVSGQPGGWRACCDVYLSCSIRGPWAR